MPGSSAAMAARTDSARLAPPSTTVTTGSCPPCPAGAVGPCSAFSSCGEGFAQGMKFLVPRRNGDADLPGYAGRGDAPQGVAVAGIARQICVAIPPGDQELHALCEAFAQELKAEHGPSAASGQGEQLPVVTVVDGGATRADSVRSALAALEDGTEAVLVHDAARALAPESVFHRVAQALAAGALAVIPVIPVVDTVKTVAATTGEDSDIAPELVTGTAPRDELRAVQTPQGFSFATLKAAHEAALQFDESRAAAVTDDAMLVELLGVPVHAVRGASQSLKITTPLDLIIAEGLLEGPLGARWVEG